MKKLCFLSFVFIFIMACDLSTSLAPTGDSSDMSATVNSIMTTFPTIDSLPTKMPTSQPTLLAPIPINITQVVGTISPSMNPANPLVTAMITTPDSLATENNPKATVTPSITPTFILEDPRNTLGPPSWIDNYANGNNWPQGSDNYTSVLFENGFMKLTALTGIDGWRLTYPNIKNFYLEANIQSINCEKSDHFGIIFRVPDISAANQGYFYGIQCDGKYFLKVFSDNLMTSLVYPKNNPAIIAGKNVVNRLGVMAEADKISLYINGSLVKEVTDNHFEHGGFGIFVGSDVVKDLTIWVDEIAYWSLQ